MEETISEIRNYINKMRILQEILLNYIDDETADLTNLISYIDQQKIRENKLLLYEFLNLISKIADNHHRTIHFFDKIENIIKYYQEDIKKYFQNYNIFNIFYKSKQILLFLFESKIIEPDYNIYYDLCEKFSSSKSSIDEHLYYYMYPKFHRPDKEYPKSGKYCVEIMDNKILKKLGHNQNEICQLIQNDSVEKFITYMNAKLIPVDLEIKPTINETNPLLLLNRKPTLIEYATFYGSIQIFQYLKNNNAKLEPFLWIYAIHSNNPEIISILEENNIEKPHSNLTDFLNVDDKEKSPYLILYNESIKCHHIELMNYFYENFLSDKNIDSFENCANYFNYKALNLDFFNDESKLPSILLFSCKYGFLYLADILLKSKLIDVNSYFSYQRKEPYEKFSCQYIYTITPLYAAVEYENIESVQFLLKNPEIDVNLISTTKELNYGFNPTRVDGIFESEDYKKYTPLFYAARYNQFEIIKLLLSHQKIDVNIINTGDILSKNSSDDFHEKCTALTYSIRYRNYYSALLLLEHPNIDVNIKYIHEHVSLSSDKINKNYIDYKEKSPLGLAINENQTEIVKLIVEKENIDINSKEVRYIFRYGRDEIKVF